MFFFSFFFSCCVSQRLFLLVPLQGILELYSCKTRGVETKVFLVDKLA